MELVLIILAVYFVINFIIAQRMQNVVILKGYGQEVHAFSMVLLFGVVGCIYVAALPDKVQRSQAQEILELLRKQEGGNATDKD